MTKDIKIRKSKRICGDSPTNIVDIGIGSNPVTDLELRRFVTNDIKYNLPQIVTLPISPSRHAFMVHVKLTEGKIMISDWGGKSNKTRGRKFKVWRQYSKLMKLLEEKYKLPIVYYAIDNKIKEKAENHHKNFKNKKEIYGSGGCSYYIFEWMETHNS
jgi:hypothetical protein